MRYRSIVYDSDRWSVYEHRAGDIVISTPPKCGTTWTQSIVAMLVLGTTDLPAPMKDLSPWVDQNVRSRDELRQLLDAQEHRRFLKSHTPADGLPWHPDVTYVTIGRDPRDAAVSADDHRQNLDLDRVMEIRAATVGLDDLAELPPRPTFLDDPVDRYWDWMTNRTTPEFAWGLQYLMLHLHSFWERRDEPNVVLLHYADMSADPRGSVRMLAHRLGIEVSDGDVDAIVEATSFESMRSRAELVAPNADQYWRDTTAFFSQGGSERWRGLIDPDDLTRYDAIARELTDDETFLGWLHRPPLAPPTP